MDFEGCSQSTKNSKVVLKENRSCFELVNPNRLQIIKVMVDGCLIEDTDERCDWILSLENPLRKALFIELKGCGLDKAISQLKSTLNKTRQKYQNYQKECYVVTTRVPKFGPSVQLKRKKFFQATSVKLNIKNNRFTLEI